MNTQDAFELVEIEYRKACEESTSFVSHYEGYSIILEAMDDLWAEIKLDEYPGRRTFIRSKTVNVAAMALRFLTNLC